MSQIRSRPTPHGRRLAATLLASVAAGAFLQPVLAQPPSPARNATELPYPPPPFQGEIAPSYRDSRQDFPQPVRAPAGAPNVLLIMLDDIGFGQASAFGGPVPMPHVDRLAAEGLRYNRFHTTAICSPTRAALLTGRNHHQCGTGTIMELSTGYPGYDSVWGRDCASVAEVLRLNGYSTAAFGKWHNTPDWETSPVGPFDRWPTGQGFEHWYGFLGGETSQWEPQLFRNTSPVEPPRRPDQGYTLNEDLADQAVAWVGQQRSVAPDKPFFVYFAPGALHAPLHAPKEWIDRFSGQFGEGWDKLREETLERQKRIGVVPQDTALTARPAEIPAWDGLTADERRVYQRQMQVFAGFAAQTDDQVGRVIDAVRRLPGGDNTLVIYLVGDNGPSAEGTLTGTLNNVMTQQGVPDDVPSQLARIDEIGGPGHENHYAVGWAWAGATPFQWMKRVPSHLGGTRNGLVVSWPGHISDAGGLRAQFHHVIDIAPTIYAAAGVAFPGKVDGAEQIPLAGLDMTYSFDHPDAPGTRRTQYFEVGGHRAIYDDGWIASAFHGVPWLLSGSHPFDQDRWELYDLTRDFSQATDLSAQQPQKLSELVELFDEEARRNNVFPLDDRFVERLANPERPSYVRGRLSFTYYAGTSRIPEGNGPPIYRRSHTITATINVPDGGAEGVIVAEGGSSAGYALHVSDGSLVYEYNYFGRRFFTVTSDRPLPTGRVEVAVRYEQRSEEPTGGGVARLSIDGQPAGEAAIESVVPARFSATETLDIGKDLGSTVSKAYEAQAPYAFTGRIDQVRIDVDPTDTDRPTGSAIPSTAR